MSLSPIDIDEFDNSVDFLLESGELPSTNMNLYDEFNILQENDFTNLHNVRTYFENALAQHESQMSDDDYGDDDVYDSLQMVVNGLRNPEQVFPFDLETVRTRVQEKMKYVPSRKMKLPMVKPQRVVGGSKKNKHKTKREKTKHKRKYKKKSKTRKYHK